MGPQATFVEKPLTFRAPFDSFAMIDVKRRW